MLVATRTRTFDEHDIFAFVVGAGRSDRSWCAVFQ